MCLAINYDTQKAIQCFFMSLTFLFIISKCYSLYMVNDFYFTITQYEIVGNCCLIDLFSLCSNVYTLIYNMCKHSHTHTHSSPSGNLIFHKLVGFLISADAGGHPVFFQQKNQGGDYDSDVGERIFEWLTISDSI